MLWIGTGEKKQIYRNFTKQFLIKSPPPVLILHLKRFEAKGAFSFRKVDTNVSFPLILDVGSFCSVTCEVSIFNNSDVLCSFLHVFIIIFVYVRQKLLYPDQKKILYSLYGIVEHSGSMNAGHYVAYVKVRQRLGDVQKQCKARKFLRKTCVSGSIFNDDYNLNFIFQGSNSIHEALFTIINV